MVHHPGMARPWAKKGLWVCMVAASLAAPFDATLSFGAIQNGSESPTDVVRATLTEVLRILGDPKLEDPAQSTSRRRMLEEIISSRFDYREMSKRTLAAQWNRLTKEQQAEFVELFKTFLSDRYGARIDDYSGEKVEYLGERLEGQYAEVRTKLVSSKTQYPMDYRLINRSGKWYAYDIVADGISLVKNYRSQFERIIRIDSYEELVKRLRNRTVTDEASRKR